MSKKKKTIKVAVLGLDGAGKSTTVSYFTQTFYKDIFVIKTGRSIYFYKKETGEKVDLFTKLLKKIDHLYEKYEKKQSRLGIIWASAFYLIAMRHMERKLIKKFKPELIISSRDITIDTMVYCDYYIPLFKFIPKFLKRFMFKLFCFFPRQSDLVIYLQLEPAESINRIKKREIKRKIDPSVMRIKSRYRHENLQALKEISKKYDEYLLGYLSKSKKTTVVYYNVNDKHTKDRTEFCGKVIKSFIKKRNK